jgi:hypothetical protein
MDSLRNIWKEETLRRVTRLESGDLMYYRLDFELLNMALRALYHIMGGKV